MLQVYKKHEVCNKHVEHFATDALHWYATAEERTLPGVGCLDAPMWVPAGAMYSDGYVIYMQMVWRDSR